MISEWSMTEHLFFTRGSWCFQLFHSYRNLAFGTLCISLTLCFSSLSLSYTPIYVSSKLQTHSLTHILTEWPKQGYFYFEIFTPKPYFSLHHTGCLLLMFHWWIYIIVQGRVGPVQSLDSINTEERSTASSHRLIGEESLRDDWGERELRRHTPSSVTLTWRRRH